MRKGYNYRMHRENLSSNDKAVKRWRLQSNGVLLFSEKYYNTLEKLEYDYDAFAQQPESLQFDSDEESLRIFRATNDDRYEIMKNNFLVKMDKSPIEYKPVYVSDDIIRFNNNDNFMNLAREEANLLGDIVKKLSGKEFLTNDERNNILDKILLDNASDFDNDIIFPAFTPNEIKNYVLNEEVQEQEEAPEDPKEEPKEDSKSEEQPTPEEPKEEPAENPPAEEPKEEQEPVTQTDDNSEEDKLPAVPQTDFNKEEWMNKYTSIIYGNDSEEFKEYAKDYIKTIKALYDRYTNCAENPIDRNRIALYAVSLGWCMNVVPTDVNFFKTALLTKNSIKQSIDNFMIVDLDTFADLIKSYSDDGDMDNSNYYKTYIKNDKYYFLKISLGSTTGNSDIADYVKLNLVTNDSIFENNQFSLGLRVGIDYTTAKANITYAVREPSEYKCSYFIPIASRNSVTNVFGTLFDNLSEDSPFTETNTPKIRIEDPKGIKLFLKSLFSVIYLKLDTFYYNKQLSVFPTGIIHMFKTTRPVEPGDEHLLMIANLFNY